METFKNLKKEIEKLNQIKGETTNEKIKKILQNENIKTTFFNDVINKIVEIWNKYEGKQLGEKTRQKIKEEVETHFDNEIFFYPYAQEFSIMNRDASKKYNGNLKITIVSKNWQNKFTEENKILKLQIENLTEQTTHCRYVENLDETVNQIIEEHQKALKLQEELNKVYNKIQTLSNHNISAVGYTSSVKNWLC